MGQPLQNVSGISSALGLWTCALLGSPGKTTQQIPLNHDIQPRRNPASGVHVVAKDQSYSLIWSKITLSDDKMSPHNVLSYFLFQRQTETALQPYAKGIPQYPSLSEWPEGLEAIDPGI